MTRRLQKLLSLALLAGLLLALTPAALAASPDLPEDPAETEQPEVTEQPEATEQPEVTEQPEITEPPAPVVLSFDSNGGSERFDPVTLPGSGLVPALPVPQEREGYIFGGWYDGVEFGDEIRAGDAPGRSLTLYAHWYRLRVVVVETLSVPAALRESYADTQAMKSAMLGAMERRTGSAPIKGCAFYDFWVDYFDGSAWRTLQAEDFPSRGVTLEIELPVHVETEDRILALHLFGETSRGHRAGEGEMPAVVRNGDTVFFTVRGASPVLIAWVDKAELGGGKAAATGDPARPGLWAGCMLLSAAAVTAAGCAGKGGKRKAGGGKA